MKNFKKIIGLLLSTVMVLSVALTVTAADTFSLTINGTTSDHTYNLYQIFKGDVAAEGTGKVISNIGWGDNIATDGLAGAGINEAAADAAATLSSEADAKAFAKTIDTNRATLLTGTPSNATATGDTTVVTGLAPGYYFVEDATSLQDQDSSYTSFILVVVGDAEVTIKSDKPTFEKKVKDVNDSTTAEGVWQDSADYDIGDDVPFQLTAKLPSNYADYETYKLVFNDTLSTGLDYKDGSLKVSYVNGTTTVDLSDTSYDLDVTGKDITVTFNNLKSIAEVNKDSKIVVEYTATLNDSAVIGATGNENTASITYSNDPNHSGEGNTNTGKTPDDKVKVFTYQVVVNKTDKDGNPLEGAGFTLYKKDSTGNYQPVGEEITGVTTFTFKGLDDGDYKLVETTVPAKYNKMDDVEFTIAATHDEISDTPTLTTLTGNVTLGDAEFTPDVSGGSLTTSVKNYMGSELPETGGMGTKVIYLVGGALVVLASVLLVTKRRMSKNQ